MVPINRIYKSALTPVNLEELQKGGKIDPMQLMKQSKKNKPVMIFVGIKGDPTEQYTEKVSGRWMQSLQNAHMPVQRYIVAPNRVMFVTQDGSMAWDIKVSFQLTNLDFLLAGQLTTAVCKELNNYRVAFLQVCFYCIN